MLAVAKCKEKGKLSGERNTNSLVTEGGLRGGNRRKGGKGR